MSVEDAQKQLADFVHGLPAIFDVLTLPVTSSEDEIATALVEQRENMDLDFRDKGLPLVALKEIDRLLEAYFRAQENLRLARRANTFRFCICINVFVSFGLAIAASIDFILSFQGEAAQCRITQFSNLTCSGQRDVNSCHFIVRVELGGKRLEAEEWTLPIEERLLVEAGTDVRFEEKGPFRCCNNAEYVVGKKGDSQGKGAATHCCDLFDSKNGVYCDNFGELYPECPTSPWDCIVKVGKPNGYDEVLAIGMVKESWAPALLGAAGVAAGMAVVMGLCCYPHMERSAARAQDIIFLTMIPCIMPFLRPCVRAFTPLLNLVKYVCGRPGADRTRDQLYAAEREEREERKRKELEAKGEERRGKSRKPKSNKREAPPSDISQQPRSGGPMHHRSIAEEEINDAMVMDDMSGDESDPDSQVVVVSAKAGSNAVGFESLASPSSTVVTPTSNAESSSPQRPVEVAELISAYHRPIISPPGDRGRRASQRSRSVAPDKWTVSALKQRQHAEVQAMQMSLGQVQWAETAASLRRIGQMQGHHTVPDAPDVGHPRVAAAASSRVQRSEGSRGGRGVGRDRSRGRGAPSNPRSHGLQAAPRQA
eukprot:TRINITY_DN63422_c0_g1_i1.p1 TRINITY_DN63422_c0_g1~~TRINITY_DN63422_c0_g1_i1.p1  ORF type:complete len:596 (-),score=112.67 TRINITY_DN63422_c0_g1_i1:12-1799(-)